MKLNFKYFLFLVGIIFTGCFSNSPAPSDNIYIPKHYNADSNYKQVENYVEAKVKQMVDLVYKDNFIKRTIATNEMELGNKTLYYRSFRIFKHVKLKTDDLDVFPRPDGYVLIPKNDLTQESLIHNSADIYYIQKPYYMTVISFNNKTQRIYFNHEKKLFLVLINKITGKINVITTNIQLCKQLSLTCFIDPKRIDLYNYKYYYVMFSPTQFSPTHITILNSKLLPVFNKDINKKSLLKEFPVQLDNTVFIFGFKKFDKK